MPIYTGVADANGDFNISFGSNGYTSGQKITVTAEKDSAEKTIELYAPSSVTGGGVIQFSGSLASFPNNIGNVTITDIEGSIAASCFNASEAGVLWGRATGLIIGSGVTSIGGSAFYGWGLATILGLPNSLLKIESNAFQNWSKLVTLVIPDSVTSIGSGCFMWSTELKELIISKSMTSIAVNTFANCSKIEAIYLPDAITTIDNQAFMNASKVKNLRIGPNCVYLGSWAFYGMGECNQILCERVTPPTIADNYTFGNLNLNCVIKVPSESVAAYKAAPGWSAFASRIQAI